MKINFLINEARMSLDFNTINDLFGRNIAVINLK